MTKKGYMPKLVAVLLGAVMCLCAATLIFTAPTSAKAEEESQTDPNKLILETVDEFDTAGYKIEVASRENESEEYPFDDETNPYDYIITVVDSTASWWNPRDGKVFFKENSHEAVWNLTTQDGKSVFGGNFNYKNCTKRTSTDDTIASFTYNNNEKIIVPDTGDRAIDPETGLPYPDQRWKTGETVMRFYFRESTGDCPTHGDVPCTCHVDGEGKGESLVDKYLSVLYRVVHIKDNEFMFTGAIKDVNSSGETGTNHGMWLTFGANDLLGVSSADGDWTRAERDDFIGINSQFFKNIYFFQNFDLENTTEAPEGEALTGNDLYSLMTGDNLKEDGWLFQTEIRNDHVEIFKRTRAYYTSETVFDREGNPVAFAEGDAFYLKAGLKMIGHDGNGNWTVASEGGAANVLKRDQFFYFDGENWSIDQFSMAISLDKKSELMETGDELTVTASVETGKFVTGADTAVTWTSSNETVATVENGVVDALASGETTIKAELADGTAATCTVTVVNATEISEIKLDKRTVTIYTGNTNNTYTFTATVTGGSKLDDTVTWTSSNEDVATVDENGKVTAVGEGQTTITATASDGVHTATATVTVLEAAEDDNPQPGPGDGDTEKPGDTPDEGCGCGGSVAGTAAMAGAVLVLGAASVLVLRKKRA